MPREEVTASAVVQGDVGGGQNEKKMLKKDSIVKEIRTISVIPSNSKHFSKQNEADNDIWF